MATQPNKPAITRYIYPQEVSEFPAYLEITMKTLSGGNFIGQLKNELVSTAKSAVKFATDIAGVIGDAAQDAFNTYILNEQTSEKFSSDLEKLLNIKNVGSVDYFAGTEKLKFITYIPADFESSIVSNWSEQELFGVVNAVLNNVDKIPFAGSLIGAAYNALKNNAQALSKTAITPKMVKLYQPSFFDFDLNFEYVFDNPQDGKNLITILRCFQESQRPTNVNNEELYNFPAVFDINIVLNETVITNGNTINISTKSGDNLNLWNHISSQKGYGLTNITITPKSGDNIDMKFRSDGINAGYNVKMSFTSLRRMFNTEGKSVTDKVDSLIQNLNSK